MMARVQMVPFQAAGPPLQLHQLPLLSVGTCCKVGDYAPPCNDTQCMDACMHAWMDGWMDGMAMDVNILSESSALSQIEP